MKIIVFRTQLFKPSERFIRDQAAALPTAEVLLLGRTVMGEPDRQLQHRTLGGGRLDALRFVVGGDVSRFVRTIRGFEASLIHAHFAVDGLYAKTIARRLDVPLVTTLHGFDITTRRFDLLQSGRPALARYALLQNGLKRDGSLFICVSDFMLRQALKAGYPEQRLRKHYIGVDTSAFSPGNLASPEPVFLHVARLVEKKGTAYLLQAFAVVLKRVPEARLEILGDGPLRTQLESLAGELGISQRVTFLGSRPHAEVRHRLGRSWCLVLPSITARNGDAEGLGMVLLEAAASAVPTVATRHGGIPEAVRDGESGILVAERNAQELAGAMLEIAADSSLRSRMGARAREIAETDFDLSRQSVQLESIYREVIG
jgi:glycosyltransferase involved in cell wall biosynthesis